MASNNDLELGEFNIRIVDEIVQSLLISKFEAASVNRSSIFKVPSVLRDISPSSYNPNVVSLGPLHREAKNVQAMEARKASCLHSLLNRFELPHEQTLKACVEKVIHSMTRIRESYNDTKLFTDVELAKMMVVDGLFILDFLTDSDKYDSDVFISQSIKKDMLLIENQIPFFVLRDLFQCTILLSYPTLSLITLINNFLAIINLFNQDLKIIHNIYEEYNPDHILGVLHSCYQPPPAYQTCHSFLSRSSFKNFYSASELAKAGVKFKPNPDPSWLMAMKVESSKFGCFSWSWGKPTLRMPVFYLDDSTESIIRNLIVYEQCYSHLLKYISSYVLAIDTLVDSKEDIAMLMASGVIINDLTSTEEAANIISSIGKDICSSDFFYFNQWFKIDEYSNGCWPTFRRIYFSRPWNFPSLLGGILIFVLTLLQTIFTIKAD